MRWCNSTLPGVSPDAALREFNSAITLRDGNAWSLRFANNYLRHEIKDYFVDGRFRINEVFRTLTRLHYDERRHRFTEQAYGLVQNLGNTWLISYNISVTCRKRESTGWMRTTPSGSKPP